MIIPYLKKNGKYSLYSTIFDFKDGDKGFSIFGDKTNLSKLDYREFDFINPFVEGFAIAESNDKPCFINMDGDILMTEHEYYELRNFENGIAVGCREYKHEYPRYRFINKNGREIIDVSFNEYSFLKKGFIEVTEYTGYAYDSFSNDLSASEFSKGLLDYTGFQLIKPIRNASFFPNNKFITVYCLSERYSNTYYHDYNGNQIYDIRFDDFDYIDTFYENRSISQLKKSKQYVIIDNEFNVIKNLEIISHLDIGERYRILNNGSDSYFIRGLYALKQNDKWGFIDLNGNFVMKPKYDFLGAFTDYKSWSDISKGCAVAGKQVNGKIKYGAINTKFEEITEFIYDEMQLFDENIATVRVKDKWGAINSGGKVVVPIDYTYISSYCINGFIEVGLGDYENHNFVGVYGFFNKQGKKITKIVYQWLGSVESGFCIVKKNNNYGLINSEGDEIITCKYDEMEGTADAGYLVQRNGTKYYVDKEGREFREE